MITETVNEVPYVEYHLRSLGITDRANCRLIASDNRVFSDGVIKAKPDYVIAHRSRNIMVISFKTRKYKGRVTEYEKYQLHAEYLAVKAELGLELVESDLQVGLGIFFADTRLMGVPLDTDTTEIIHDNTFDAISQLHRLGIYDNTQTFIESSKLARYFVDPWFENPAFDRQEATEFGTEQHRKLFTTGPATMQ